MNQSLFKHTSSTNILCHKNKCIHVPYRIKEEPSAEIQFPVLDENDEVIEAERFLQLEGKSVN